MDLCIPVAGLLEPFLFFGRIGNRCLLPSGNRGHWVEEEHPCIPLPAAQATPIFRRIRQTLGCSAANPKPRSALALLPRPSRAGKEDA